MEDQDHWSLDKRVPVVIILALLGQLFAGGWFISGLVKDVDTNTKSIQRLDTQIDVLRTSSQNQAIQLGRIEEQITGLRGDIALLLSKIERDFR